jgi:hypothetical protein
MSLPCRGSAAHYCLCFLPTGKLNPDALQRAGQLLKALEEDAAGNPFLKALLPGNSA